MMCFGLIYYVLSVFWLLDPLCSEIIAKGLGSIWNPQVGEPCARKVPLLTKLSLLPMKQFFFSLALKL